MILVKKVKRRRPVKQIKSFDDFEEIDQPKTLPTIEGEALSS